MKQQNKIRIAYAEDHQILRQGMLAMLSTEQDFEIVFDVSNGAELIESLNHNKVDIVILDIEMPIMNGLEALKIISMKFPEVKVVMLSSYYENEMIYQAITDGARGFLPKHAEIEEVIEALNNIMIEGYYFDDKVTPKLIAMLKRHGIIFPPFELDTLSNRELEILPLICQGMKNKEIAEQLFISERTVENHRKHLFFKTNAKNAYGLIVYAIRNGLIKLI
jgi:DNA-binding NarL/FixJ family response regulator